LKISFKKNTSFGYSLKFFALFSEFHYEILFSFKKIFFFLKPTLKLRYLVKSFFKIVSNSLVLGKRDKGTFVGLPKLERMSILIKKLKDKAKKIFKGECQDKGMKK